AIDPKVWVITKLDGSQIDEPQALSRGDIFALKQMYAPDTNPAGDVYAAVSAARTGPYFDASAKINESFCYGPEDCQLGDFDGDGHSDLITFQHGHWGNGAYVSLSDGAAFTNGQPWHSYFCLAGDVCAVGDLNGDGA